MNSAPLWRVFFELLSRCELLRRASTGLRRTAGIVQYPARPPAILLPLDQFLPLGKTFSPRRPPFSLYPRERSRGVCERHDNSWLRFMQGPRVKAARACNVCYGGVYRSEGGRWKIVGGYIRFRRNNVVPDVIVFRRAGSGALLPNTREKELLTSCW